MEGSFWTTTALQLATSENPVKHALIAVATMHSTCLQDPGSEYDTNQTFALRGSPSQLGTNRGSHPVKV